MIRSISATLYGPNIDRSTFSHVPETLSRDLRRYHLFVLDRPRPHSQPRPSAIFDRPREPHHPVRRILDLRTALRCSTLLKPFQSSDVSQKRHDDCYPGACCRMRSRCWRRSCADCRCKRLLGSFCLLFLKGWVPPCRLWHFGEEELLRCLVEVRLSKILRSCVSVAADEVKGTRRMFAQKHCVFEKIFARFASEVGGEWLLFSPLGGQTRTRRLFRHRL